MEKHVVQLLDHHKPVIADKIYVLFQRSYRIEAELVGVDDFPPLNRTVDEFVNSENRFYGCFDEEKLIAAVEVLISDELLEICSLVVDPAFFRKGIASQVMTFIMENFGRKENVVETAAVNLPAIDLYHKFGFSIEKKWTIDIGIEKVMMRCKK